MNNTDGMDMPKLETKKDVKKFVEEQINNPSCAFALSIKVDDEIKSIPIKKIVKDLGIDVVVDFMYDSLINNKGDMLAYNLQDIIEKAKRNPESLTKEERAVLDAVSSENRQIFDEIVMSTVNAIMGILCFNKDSVFRKIDVTMEILLKFIKSIFVFSCMKDKEFIITEDDGLYELFKNTVIEKLKAGESNGLDNKAIFIGLLEWMVEIITNDKKISEADVNYSDIIDNTGLDKELIESINGTKYVEEDVKPVKNNISDIRTKLKRNN